MTADLLLQETICARVLKVKSSGLFAHHRFVLSSLRGVTFVADLLGFGSMCGVVVCDCGGSVEQDLRIIHKRDKNEREIVIAFAEFADVYASTACMRLLQVSLSSSSMTSSLFNVLVSYLGCRIKFSVVVSFLIVWLVFLKFELVFVLTVS